MRGLVLCLLLLLAWSPLQAEAPTKIPPLWYYSVGAMGLGSALDGFSSWGKCCELNPIVRGPGGYPSRRGVWIKAAVFAGTVIGERWLLKGHPRAAGFLSRLNFGIATGYGVIAVMNFRVH